MRYFAMIALAIAAMGLCSCTATGNLDPRAVAAYDELIGLVDDELDARAAELSGLPEGPEKAERLMEFRDRRRQISLASRALRLLLVMASQPPAPEPAPDPIQ